MKSLPSSSPPRSSLPRPSPRRGRRRRRSPSGPAPVGFTRTTLTDHQRVEPLAGDTGPRRVPLRVWYPGGRSRRRARGAAHAGRAGRARRRRRARAQRARRPGLGGHRGRAGRARAPSRAAAFARPGRDDRAAVGPCRRSRQPRLRRRRRRRRRRDVRARPGRRRRPCRCASPRRRPRSIALRTRDLRFVIGKLESLRGIGRLDRDRVGAFGHSNGGATAADADAGGPPDPRRREHRRRHLRTGHASAGWTARSGS